MKCTFFIVLGWLFTQSVVSHRKNCCLEKSKEYKSDHSALKKACRFVHMENLCSQFIKQEGNYRPPCGHEIYERLETYCNEEGIISTTYDVFKIKYCQFGVVNFEKGKVIITEPEKYFDEIKDVHEYDPRTERRPGFKHYACID